MKYFVILSLLLAVASAIPRKFLDGHPQDDQWGKLDPAQAAERQQNDYRQGNNQFGAYGGFNQPQPGYQQPGYQQPGYQQPGYQQPGYQQPGYQQPGYQQPGYQQQGYQPQYGAQYGSPYNQYGAPQKGKKGKKGKNEGQPIQPPMQPYGQAPYGQQPQPQQPGQCASPCSQACAPSCSSQCCGANNAFTAMQPPPSMTQSSCPGACPNSCAPVCSQKCCWDKRTTIPRPAAIPHPYQQYYY